MSKHRRGPWSQTEDQYLLQLVHSQGAHNWVRISQMIQSRSPKQCRERYHQNLKPSLNMAPITPEEGVLIERMVQEMGKRWAEIARRLNGRSDNAIKNWWNGGMNRRKRLESRRPDGTRRVQGEAPGVKPSMPQPSSMNAQQPPMVGAPHPPPPQAFDQWGQQRPLPYPINTANPHLKPPMHRRPLDTPLPSPSAMSSISRSDSSEGAPPSLISDNGSYTGYTQSPGTSPNHPALPPLQPNNPNGFPQQSYPGSTYTRGYPTPMDFAAEQYKNQAYQHAYYQFGTGQIHDGWGYQQPVVPSQRQKTPPNGQLPLPNFRTITEPNLRPLEPPSPPRDNRDNRMNLSNVID